MLEPTRIAGPAGVLAVDDGGSGGLPVVFVHSLAGDAGHWSSQLEHLRNGRRAVAFDLRGHGRSDEPQDRDYSMGAMALDVAAVVDSLGLVRFVLVGHSMGGGVVLAYAGAQPSRVAGVILVDPIVDMHQAPAVDMAEVTSFLERLQSAAYDSVSQEYWSQISGPDAAIRERLLRDLRETPRTSVVESFKAVLAYDPKPALRRYRGPILSIITPYNDLPYSLHRLGEGFAHELVTGTGHWLQLDRPEEFNATLEEFIAPLEHEVDQGKAPPGSDAPADGR